MAYLYDSGSSISHLVNTVLGAVSTPRAQKMFSEARDFVQDGLPLSNALYHAGIINQQEQAIIAGAEKTGDLGKALAMVVEHLEWREEIKFRLDKALRFSSILLILVVLVCALITQILLPKLLYFAQSGEVIMPMVTDSFLAFAIFLKQYGLYLVGIPFLLWVVGLSLYQMSHIFKFCIDGAFLKLPVFGQTSRLNNQVRFLRIFGNLLNQGVGHKEALNLASLAMHNAFLTAKIIKASDAIDQGYQVSEVLKQAGFLPDLVIFQLSLAEERGQLAKAALQSAVMMNDKLVKKIDRVSSQMEPALAGLTMLIIFWIVIAVVAPIYDAVIMIN